MMREVLAAALQAAAEAAADGAAKPKPDDDSFPQWPDLVIIDGGRGQLNAVREIFDGSG
jgi:excinuclease ABC subunit C